MNELIVFNNDVSAAGFIYRRTIKENGLKKGRKDKVVPVLK
jgi:hypothetical protein